MLVGFECMHLLWNNRKTKDGFAAVKLDMSKAYDRVEWPFLFRIMGKMGFPQPLIDLIRRCVSSVTYVFQINDHLIGRVAPRRGIRQGDLLSPHQFVLCSEGLSAMINAYARQGLFRGIRIARASPMVSHLFFADGSLVFFRATQADCQQVAHCLRKYERATGQL